MYVIYPLICYNASHALHSSTKLLELCTKTLGPSTFRLLNKAVKGSFIALYATLSLARILAQLRAFSAPMHVYNEVRDYSTVCLGKEWYRFPSSFFTPENSRALFVKSAFNGLLPGRFPDSEYMQPRSGTWQIPIGMNDRNLEETSHHVQYLFKSALMSQVQIALCDYLVDSDFPLRYTGKDAFENSLEPRYAIMEDTWSRADCKAFLDAKNSGLFGRSFWLPVNVLDSTAWGQFCLLERSHSNVSVQHWVSVEKPDTIFIGTPISLSVPENLEVSDRQTTEELVSIPFECKRIHLCLEHL